MQVFLSCLFGSEPHIIALAVGERFLSCLFGSERMTSEPEASNFLSCLFGSERGHAIQIVHRAFLSCLFGGEHHAQVGDGVLDLSELPIRQ